MRPVWRGELRRPVELLREAGFHPRVTRETRRGHRWITLTWEDGRVCVQASAVWGVLDGVRRVLQYRRVY